MKLLDTLLSLSRPQKRALSVLSDVAFLFFAIWAAYALRLEAPRWLPDRNQMVAATLTVVFTVAVFIRLGLYRAVIRYLGDGLSSRLSPAWWFPA